MIINVQPEILIKTSVYFCIFCKFFKTDANNPDSIIITHCPKAKANNIKKEVI